MKLVKILLFFVCAFAMNSTFAQNLMNIHQGNGTLLQIPLESIDSVRFYTIPPPTIQKIFQSNGNILSIAISDIDSITYTIPNSAALASIITQAVTVLSSSSAYSGGTISSDGGSVITQRGVCWSTSANPTLANNFSIDGTGIGSFGSNVIPLQSNTTYFVRAYAVNSEGTAYGNQLTFTTSNPSTSGSLATISTANVTYTDGLTATCGGDITADGGLAVTSRGVCWAIGTTPTINNNITVDGAGGGNYISTLSSLLPNTSYFVRAYATNDAGTSYGISYSFTTFSFPTVTTDSITSITGSSAISGGNIINNGGSNLIQKGVCWSTSSNPTIADNNTQNGSSGGSFSSNISGLSPVTTYYVRAYAINGIGILYGNQVTFITIALLPTIITSPISNITATNAVSGGVISNDGGAPVTQRGVCWNTSQNPTIENSFTNDGAGSGTYMSSITGLTDYTTYYVRAYSINNAGTAYGNQQSFTTNILTNPGVGVTYNGYTYSSVVLGNGQEWMSENLRTANYRNGDPIPTGLNDATWGSTAAGAYAIYNNDNANDAIYGKLYNWYAVADSRHVCPTGWHEPTDAEWTTLTNYLGGETVAGGKMKTTGMQYWTSPNTDATNESGFSGLPVGFRWDGSGGFGGLGGQGYWWSSSESSATNAWFRLLYFNDGIAYRFNSSKQWGYSVRCLKD